MNDCRTKGSICVGGNAILNFIKSNYNCCNTGRIIIFSVITNIYSKKAKGCTLMELFTTTGKLKKLIF
jgi:hypothetical protein